MTRTVSHGTPLRETDANAAGACPCLAKPNNMRPAPNVSELIAEIAAVMTTTLRIEAAAGMPRAVKICTNGLASAVMWFHGTSDMMTTIVIT